MSIDGGLLVAPVGMGDISQVVHHSSLDLGTLVSNGTINKWAKYQPVSYQSWGILTEAQRASTNYGLTAPADQSSFSSVISPASGTNQWVYTRPSGGNASPFRMLDFDGYDENALPPVQAVGDITVYRAIQSSFEFSNYISQNMSRYWIGWDVLPAISGWYLCAAFAKNSAFTGTTIYKTSSETLGNGPTLTLSSTDLDTLQTNGYTHYFLCAAQVAKTSFTTAEPGNQRFRMLPSNNSDDLTGAFTFSNGLAARVEFKTACFNSNPTSASSFTDVTNYTEARVDPQYLLINNYYLHLGLDITAFSNMDCPLTASAITIAVSPTFAGGSPSGIRLMTSGGMRNSSFTSVSTLNIPRGTTQRVYFLFSNATLKMNSSGQEQSVVTTGQQLTPIIRLYQSGTNFANVSINLQN